MSGRARLLLDLLAVDLVLILFCGYQRAEPVLAIARAFSPAPDGLASHP